VWDNRVGCQTPAGEIRTVGAARLQSALSRRHPEKSSAEFGVRRQLFLIFKK
jgi:hypothetical protein